jgi:hypothetical protein
VPRLPKPGGDAGSWGDVLNEFLSQEHNADGSLKRGAEIDAKYDKPVGGIPKADLDAAAQSSLDKADNANAYTDAKTSLLTPGPSEIVVGAADGTPITVPFWRNALASGAKADNATDDAATLQGELDAIAARGGGVLFLPVGPLGGTYLIGQTLKAGSNTTLVCAPGVTVRAKAGTRSYTLTNKDWTNGNTNIHVLGGTWDTNGTNNPTTGLYPANWPGFGMLFVQVDKLEIGDNAHLDSPKFAICLAQCTNFSVHDLTFDTPSDGVHIHGLSMGGVVERIHGYTGDDFVALVSKEWVNAATIDGPIGDITIRDLFPANALGNAVKMTGDGARPITGVLVDTVDGSVQKKVVAIVDDSTHGETPCTVDDITLRNLRCRQNINGDVIQLAATGARSITIEGLHHLTGQAVDVMGGAQVESLTIRGVASRVQWGGKLVTVRDADTVVTKLHLHDVQADLGVGGIVFNHSATITNLMMTDCTITGPSSAYFYYAAAASTAPTACVLDGITASGVAAVVTLLANQTVQLDRVTATGLSSAVVLVNGAGVLGRILAGRVNSISGVYLAGGATVSIDGEGFPVRADRLTPQALDRIYNTNASALGGVGRYLRSADNTKWKNLYTGTEY